MTSKIRFTPGTYFTIIKLFILKLEEYGTKDKFERDTA